MEKSFNEKRLYRVLFALFCVGVFVTQAFGFNAIDPSDIGYDFWNMANTLATGAVGKTIGFGMLCWLLQVWLAGGQGYKLWGFGILLSIVALSNLPSLFRRAGGRKGRKILMSSEMTRSIMLM